MYSYGSPHTAAQKQDDQHERTFSSYRRIQVVVLKTCLGRWTIGRSGERGSGISVLPARYDDDDDDTQLNVKILIFQTIQFSVSTDSMSSFNRYWNCIYALLVNWAPQKPIASIWIDTKKVPFRSLRNWRWRSGKICEWRKISQFRSQFENSHVFSNANEICYNETLSLWMTIYIYIYNFNSILNQKRLVTDCFTSRR